MTSPLFCSTVWRASTRLNEHSCTVSWALQIIPCSAHPCCPSRLPCPDKSLALMRREIKSFSTPVGGMTASNVRTLEVSLHPSFQAGCLSACTQSLEHIAWHPEIPCTAVDYKKREEPEHKVERNLLRNSDNLFESYDSIKSRDLALEHQDSSKSSRSQKLGRQSSCSDSGEGSALLSSRVSR